MDPASLNVTALNSYSYSIMYSNGPHQRFLFVGSSQLDVIVYIANTDCSECALYKSCCMFLGLLQP